MRPLASLTSDEIALVKEMVRSSKTRSKEKWRTIAGLVVSNLLTLGVLLVTWYGSLGTNKAAQLQEATSQLSVEPNVEVVQAVFHPFANPPYPPHI
jgi:hypothetical protein